MAQRVPAQHCVAGLCTLNFQLLDHIVESLEKFGIFSCTDAALLEHFGVPTTQSYGMKSRRLSTKMQENMQNMENLVSIVGRTEEEVDTSVCGAAVPKTRQCLEREEYV